MCLFYPTFKKPELLVYSITVNVAHSCLGQLGLLAWNSWTRFSVACSADRQLVANEGWLAGHSQNWGDTLISLQACLVTHGHWKAANLYIPTSQTSFCMSHICYCPGEPGYEEGEKDSFLMGSHKILWSCLQLTVLYHS